MDLLLWAPQLTVVSTTVKFYARLENVHLSRERQITKYTKYLIVISTRASWEQGYMERQEWLCEIVDSEEVSLSDDIQFWVSMTEKEDEGEE